jgi:hypothetical protein
MIPFLVDIHGHVPGDKAQALTAAIKEFVASLQHYGVTFTDGDAAFNMATVRHGWLCTRVFWEQDKAMPQINHQRNESIQVTENLLTGTTQGSYEHYAGR